PAFINTALSQDYIVMGTPQVNIRTGPGTDYVIIGRAEKGDIYIVVDKKEGWYEITMFSGENRYVCDKDYVYPLQQSGFVPGHNMTLPESEVKRISIYRSVQKVKERAAMEANEIIPTSVSEEKNMVLRKILEDRLILETLHIYGFQPALYEELMRDH
ncbi:MAG: SH3 domain-containing protein, partial [Bacteroidales bacterium]|nr:SH3 domain-containing protein [Bacteroidales bacterium]